VKDLITESRARLPAVELPDLLYVRDVLYRDSFGTLAANLRILQRTIVERPLPDAALSHLPRGLTSTRLDGPSIPLPAPHRVIVERGGFADRLAPLPPEADVDAWFRLMQERGTSTVAGFDVLSAAFQEFDQEMGRLRLKIAGLDVPRAAARDGALILLALLAFQLTFRIRQARAFLAHAGESGLSARTPGMILYADGARSVLGWLIDATSGLGATVVALIVLASPGGTTLHPAVPPALFALVAVMSLAAAVERRRLVHGTRNVR